MTDKEIMQALNYCTSKSISCQKCPLLRKSKCERELIQYSFELINRQQAEIEICAETIKRQDKEIERLKREKERLSENVIAVMNSAENHYSELFDEAEEIVRAEAIKEFADRFDDVLARMRDEYTHFGRPEYGLVCEVVHHKLVKTLREKVGAENG